MTRMLWFVPLFATLACDPTVAGKNDVLRFRYDADDTFLPSAFNTPIGVGLAARVEVFLDTGDGGIGDEGDDVPANVVDASSSNADVVTVVATAGNVITLLGKGPGSAEIRVQSTRGDDAFDVRIVDVAKVDVQHPGVLVSDDPPSKGMVGGTARFILALRDASGAAAIGFGDLDVEVTPSGAASVVDSEEVGFVPVRFNVPGTATITGRGDEALTVDIVADAEVTGLELLGPSAVQSIKNGGELAAVLRGKTDAGEKVVGVAALATVASSDTAVCSITPNPKLGEGAYLIHGNAVGTCRVSATLGARSVQYDISVTAQ